MDGISDFRLITRDLGILTHAPRTGIPGRFAVWATASTRLALLSFVQRSQKLPSDQESPSVVCVGWIGNPECARHARIPTTGGAPAVRRYLCGPCGHGILASVGGRTRCPELGHAEAAKRFLMTSVLPAEADGELDDLIAQRGTSSVSPGSSTFPLASRELPIQPSRVSA